MLFNSLTFALFLPICFTLFWLINKSNNNLRNALLLLASYIFYGWWDWRFLSLIIFSSFVDFFIGQKLYEEKNDKKKKRWLALSMISNLSLLGFFKYFDFFVESFITSFSLIGLTLNANTLNIILPVGISFYTFQTMSYTIDIYREKMKPTNSMLSFFAFVSFFPQLVAGPIERASNLLPQFNKLKTFDYNLAKNGLQLILWGLFKKVVIADRLSEYVDAIYNNPAQFTGIAVIIGTVFFAFQIYCDFSGYSDIAIGTAKLFGFNLMTNFRTPYFSKSIKEFWSRWHISLSTWFRDYCYIPLGGNRVSTGRWLSNLNITFMVSGLWHGANWTFIVWGMIHGIINSIEALAAKYKIKNNLPSFLKMALTFSIVCFAWIFFRANHVSDAFLLIGNIPKNIGTQLSSFSEIILVINSFVSSTKEFQYLILSFVIFLIIEVFFGKEDINEKINRLPKWGRWASYYLVGGWIVYFGAFNNSGQFIYFQF